MRLICVSECLRKTKGDGAIAETDEIQPLKGRDSGNYSHFLDHKRATRTPRVKGRIIIVRKQQRRKEMKKKSIESLASLIRLIYASKCLCKTIWRWRYR